MPSSSSPCSSGTVIVERMPCMMIECAAEKRLSIVASDDSTAALLLHDLAEDRLRQHDLLVLAVAGPRDLRRGDAVLHEQDDAAVGRDELERLHDDLLEQDLEVDLEADRAAELVREAQLLVVAAQDLDVEDLLLGQELARRGRRLDLLADERLGRRGRDRDLLQQRVLGRALLEGEARRAERDLVAVAEDVLADALAAQERAVELPRSRNRNRPSGWRMICACSFETMRSRICSVLSGCRPTVLTAPSSYSRRWSLPVTMILAMPGEAWRAS